MTRRRYVQLAPAIPDDRPVWYRFDDSPYESGGRPYLTELRVVRETPKCVVLDHYGYEKLVLKEARKRFAYPTVELAAESYRIRKSHQIAYLAARHDTARENLKAAKALELGLAAYRGLTGRG